MKQKYRLSQDCWEKLGHLDIFPLQCTKTDGSTGDGTTQGTCANSIHKCQADGTCAFCATSSSLPHTGCTELNPVCNGGTECTCNPSSSTTCNSVTSSICDGASNVSPYSGGTCKCGLVANFGSGVICSSPTPKCSGTGVSATCGVRLYKNLQGSYNSF